MRSKREGSKEFIEINLKWKVKVKWGRKKVKIRKCELIGIV